MAFIQFMRVLHAHFQKRLTMFDLLYCGPLPLVKILATCLVVYVCVKWFKVTPATGMILAILLFVFFFMLQLIKF